MCSLTLSLTAIDFKVSLVGASGVCQLTADYTATYPQRPSEPYGVWHCLHSALSVLSCILDLHVCVKNNKTLDGES